MHRCCPNCQIELNPEMFRGIQIDVCHACAGIWFDEGELKALELKGAIELIALEEAWIPDVIHSERPESRHSCPGCTGVLDRFRYLNRKEIEMACCRECGGVWADEGTLGRVEKALQEQHHQEKTPKIHSRESLVASLATIIIQNRPVYETE